MVSRRHLPQRDDPPRRRDPARARRRSSRRTTTSRSTSSRSATSRTTRRAGRPRADGSPTSGRSCCGSPRIVAGQGPTPTSTRSTTSSAARGRRRRATRLSVDGRDAAELLAALAPRRGPERAARPHAAHRPVRRRLRRGPDGLSLDVLEAQPARHRPRRRCSRACPRCCARRRAWSSSRPSAIVADVDAAARPRSTRARRRARARRPPRPALEQLVDAQPPSAGEGQAPLHAAGPPRRRRAARPRRRRAGPCALRASGSVEVPVEVTDAIMPGVVSIPHGWGHDRRRRRHGRRRARTPGVNTNLLTDERALDPLSGNAVLNGIPVEVGRWRSARGCAGLDRTTCQIAGTACCRRSCGR